MNREEVDKIVRKQVADNIWALQEEMRERGATPPDFYAVLTFTLVSMAAFAAKSQGVPREKFEQGCVKLATDEGYAEDDDDPTKAN